MEDVFKIKIKDNNIERSSSRKENQTNISVETKADSKEDIENKLKVASHKMKNLDIFG